MAIRKFCTQRSNILRGLARAVFVVTALVVASPVSAQTQQQMNWCGGENDATPQQRIDGCTAAIESGNYAGDNLAMVFNNRGNSYADKHLYNLANADFEQALKLNPQSAATLSSRDSANASKKEYQQVRPPEQRGMDQQQFLRLLSDHLEEYEAGANELQKTATRKNRDNALCSKYPNPVFVGWAGSLYLSGDNSARGVAHIKFSSDDMLVTLHSQRISPSSPMYTPFTSQPENPWG